jgi:hypothetical protein
VVPRHLPSRRQAVRHKRNRLDPQTNREIEIFLQSPFVVAPQTTTESSPRLLA